MERSSFFGSRNGEMYLSLHFHSKRWGVGMVVDESKDMVERCSLIAGPFSVTLGRISRPAHLAAHQRMLTPPQGQRNVI